MPKKSERLLVPSSTFDYEFAFSRNVGWVSAQEQSTLREARVAVAGLGGVGGAHVLTLARLGIGRFNIADFDRFEVHNFNRQAGASMPFLGQPKVDVIGKLASDINPEADIRLFSRGVTPENVDDFLTDVAACRKRGIPALTAAPLGMGVSLLAFHANGMSFEEYFRLEGFDRQEQLARFIAGLSPAMLQRHYLVAPEAVNFAQQRGPSTMMACDLCAGVMGTSVLKLLLGRGPIKYAPWAMQFDAYRQKLRFTWRPFGNANPLQQLLLMLIRPRLRSAEAVEADPHPD